MDSRSATSQDRSTILPNSINDEIIDFDNLRENVTGKLNLDNWMVLQSQQTLHIFSLNKKLNGNLSIRNTICIDIDLVVKVFGENDDDTLFILKLYSWPQLQTLIEQCGVQVKREVNLEFVGVADKTVNSGTNNCEVRDQQDDTLAFQVGGLITKTEVPDFHQPLTQLIESSIADSEALEYNDTVLSQGSFIHDAPLVYAAHDDQNADLLVYKRGERSPPQSQMCPICNKSCAIGELDRHMQQHLSGDSYQCHICGQKYRMLIGLQKHVKVKHGTTRDEFFCGICKTGRDFETKENIENHMKNRHCKAPINEQELNCSICGKQFLTLKKFKAHARVHDRSKWKTCTICNKSYGSLTRHMNGKHLNIKDHICEICGAAYTQWTWLNYHMETKHMNKPSRKREDPSIYPCETCGKTFPFKRSLSNHSKLHSGKLHVCDECGQSFRHPKYLKRHLKQHKDIVKLRCTMCEKEYVQKVGLRLHMKKVHGVVIGTTQNSDNTEQL